MKRVACLCTIQTDPPNTPVSSKVMEVFNSIRTLNKDNQLTGVVIVCEHYLLMIIEGHSTQLGNAIFSIRQDAIIKDFSIILNKSIERLGFSSLNIKLLSSTPNKNNKLQHKIANLIKGEYELKSKIDEQRLDVFLPNTSIQNENISAHHIPEPSTKFNSEASNNSEFANTIISLTGWPKPGTIQFSQDLMKVCARLVGRPQRYEDVLHSRLLGTEALLNSYLSQLNELGLLKYQSHAAKPPLIGIPGGLAIKNQPKKAGQFNQVLRNFLSAAK